MAIDTFELQVAIINLRDSIRSGASWPSIVQQCMDIVRLASGFVKDVQKMTNDEKQAFCVQWAIVAYDAAVATITASITNWWMIPLFSAARMVLVKFLPGIVDWIYQRTVKISKPA